VFLATTARAEAWGGAWIPLPPGTVRALSRTVWRNKEANQLVGLAAGNHNAHIGVGACRANAEPVRISSHAGLVTLQRPAADSAHGTDL